VECLAVPAGFIRPASPEIDTRGALSDGRIGVLTSIPPMEPSSEPQRTCVFEATIEAVDQEDPGITRVLVHERDGRKTTSVVYRDRGEWRGVGSLVGEFEGPHPPSRKTSRARRTPRPTLRTSPLERGLIPLLTANSRAKLSPWDPPPPIDLLYECACQHW
jgi:hypothetical protein